MSQIWQKIILRPLIYDCLLSIQHHFYPQRTHFPESPFHIFFRSEFVNGRSASKYGRWKCGEVIIFSMLQHGWTWHHTVGLLEVLMWLYRLRCLLGAFPEPLGNYSIFPHETFDNYSICIFKWGLQWLFLQSSATAYLTFTYEALPTFLQSLIPILIHSFIPIRLRMVLFFRVNPNYHPCPWALSTPEHKVNSVKNLVPPENEPTGVAYWLFSNVSSTFFIGKTSFL